MLNRVFDHDRLPDNIVAAIASRDAALWVRKGFDENSDEIAQLVELIGLPWRLVLCESSSSELAQVLESQEDSRLEFTQQRGFVYVVTGDPEHIELPRRAPPVFLLNGRDGASDRQDSSSLKGHPALRRRLNMINELVTAMPKQLVVLSCGQEPNFDDVTTLWDEDFRAMLAVVSNSDTERQVVAE